MNVTPETIARFHGNNWHDSIVPGSPITAVGTYDIRELTRGKDYAAINGCEAGIFEDRPYVAVVADDGNVHHYHLSRFIPGRLSFEG